METIDITRFDTGKLARVRELQGVQENIRKLEAMGIIPGTVILKKSASPMHGPVIIQKGTMQIAIGFDLAKGILVDPLD